MDYVRLLGSESFREGNFFYDLHETDFFNLEAYIELIKNIRLYKEEEYNSQFVNKDITGMLFSGMRIFSGSFYMWYNNQTKIYGVDNVDIFNDYLNELESEIHLMLVTSEDK